MKIETKFDIGQDVYYVGGFYNRKGEVFFDVVQCRINKINICEYADKPCIFYDTDDGMMIEDRLYETPNEADERLKEIDYGDTK